ncbi:MAG: hypothetical protein VX000_13840, partial [Myxococcota bacterium]|nr:hypothetical protein [Myxococcota bacterium]
MSDNMRALRTQMTQLGNRFGQVVRQAQIYGEQHPALDAAVDDVVHLAAEVFKMAGPVGFSLAMPRIVIA